MTTPDRSMALSFIEALTGSPATTVTLQMKRDAPGDQNLRLAVHHWDFIDDRLWDWVKSETQHGVAVWVMVNRGDLNGRAAKNVTALRALFIDDDKQALPPDSPRLAPLPPSVSVRTKNGYHHYWSLIDGELLDRFQPAQRSLAAHFGTDVAVSDLGRVMRVPGTLHTKVRSDPFLVKLIPGTNARHFIDDILRAYPPPAGKRPPAATHAPSSARKQGAHVVVPTRAEARAVLALSLRQPLIRWATENPDDVGYTAWLAIAANLYAAAFGHDDVVERARLAFHAISEGHRRYRPGRCDALWRSVVGGLPRPTLFSNLDGVPDEVCVGGPNLVSAARHQLRGIR